MGGLTVLFVVLVVYVPIAVVERTSLEGLNYMADTLMYCGAVLLLAGAMPREGSGANHQMINGPQSERQASQERGLEGILVRRNFCELREGEFFNSRRRFHSLTRAGRPKLVLFQHNGY
jgi:hypothetical protein